jgi:hypothetical protein
MEIIDAMYMDVYKEQMGYLTYWRKQELLKNPADTLLNKVSSYKLVDNINPISNTPESYTTQNGVYLYTHGTGTSFYIEIFKGRCIDIKARTTTYTFPFTNYFFIIPKSALGGAVAGQFPDLWFTSYNISNTLQSIENEMKHYTDLMHKLAVRRQYRYGTMCITDYNYITNPNGGLKTDLITPTFTDLNSGEIYDKYKLSVNLDLNDFYITSGNGAIALNLTNKIDGTLTYNTTTRKIGVNTTAAQTFGNITTGTISSTSINTNNNNITMGTGDLSCDVVTCGTVNCGGDINGNGAGGYWKLTRPDTWIRLKDAGSNHLDFAAGKNFMLILL